MSNPYYTATGYPTFAAAGDSASARSEFAAIQAGFNLLPSLVALRLVRINATGTAMESVTPATAGIATVALTQGNQYGILSSVAGTNTITATASPTLTAYVKDQLFQLESAGANVGSVTIAIDGLATLNLNRPDGSSLRNSDIGTAGYPMLVQIRASDAVLLNPAGFSSNTFQQQTLITTSAGTTTLTASSTYEQIFQGSTTQTCVLPVVSTLSVGQSFWLKNESTGIVTVNSSGANLVVSLNSGDCALVTCILITGTTAASWDLQINAQRNGDSTQVFNVAAATAAGHAVRLGQINSTTVPAFSAYQSVAQTISSGIATKVNLQTKEFDTTSAFDNVTNMRFTPTIGGFYQVIGQIQFSNAVTVANAYIYKNGANYKNYSNTSGVAYAETSAIVQMNGSSDYIELWTAAVGTTPAISANSTVTYFQASLILRT